MALSAKSAAFQTVGKTIELPFPNSQMVRCMLINLCINHIGFDEY